MKVIIVGGVAGGASAAARLRRLDENAEITIYEKSGFISYANCGLPYYIGGVIKDKKNLTLQTPQSFNKRFNINIKIRHEVTGIDPQNRTVTVKNLDDGTEFTDCYEKLILSPGAKAIRPPVKGIDSKRIFTLRTVEDTLKISEFIKENNIKTAVVVGGGFIGIEAAENLIHCNVGVTLVEAAPQVLSIFDMDMIPQIHTALRSNGVELKLGNGISSFEDSENSIASVLSNGDVITSDIVILAIGVTPDSSLAKDAGLKTGIKGSIIVDDTMLTSNKDIYAVGDAVEVKHFITGKEALISLAGPANKQGRIAADNIAGKNSRYKGTLGTSVIKVFDMTVASAGINERYAKAESMEYDKIILSPASHASYYPGGKVMTIKVLFNKAEDRLLGAQIAGFDGVDKRIDVLATAIRAGMKASELAELELAYAPPYSSAKDPVNMIGFMIENIENGVVKQFYYEDVERLQKDSSVYLLDSRTPNEYSKGHAEGFINIPVDEIRNRLSELPKDKKIYIMCQSGLRSYITCRILSGSGFDCYNFTGGYRFYSMVKNEELLNKSSYPCGMDKD